MDLRKLIESKRDEILSLAARHGARNLRIFGSIARGTSTTESDIDLLVDLEPGRTLFDLGAFLVDLEEMLGCRIDVLTEAALHWYIRDRVLEEAVPL